MAVNDKIAEPAPAADIEVTTTKADDQSAKKNILQKKPDGFSGFCCYIGPTIIGVIQSGTIYPKSKAEVLKDLESEVKKHPLIASLVVGGETLATDRIKVKTPGNLLFVNYRKLASGKNK
ncbi:hypothetical protein [Anaeromassilibacillus senegalensis]|uniref:hypothetical protein n=1 Tax=Anaeromassilibacillus senegalensis TaxID=1673717 RepID=UPI0006820055|nr:hypothetical protein [Anaeromassilibacillus senegalensis]